MGNKREYFMEDKLLTYVECVAHIGIAVPSIAEAQKFYELFGFKEESAETIDEDLYGVRVKMMKCGDSKIELLEPLSEGKESPIDTYISTKPYKMYHLAYICSNFEAQIKLLRENKFVLVNEPRPSKSMGGKRAVFMFNRKLGIVELCEK